MKPSYPWLAPLALLSLTSLACAPDNKVKPGAPVLLSITIMGPGGAATEITGDAKLCLAAVGPGGACVPGMDNLCRLGASTWCHCVGSDEMDPKKGNWACDPLAPMSSIVATFDRLLDTKPFEVDGGAAATVPAGIVTLMAGPSTALDATVAYVPNGDLVGLLLGNKGPRLTITPSPTLPAGSTITVTLDKTKIRAKDGKTGFTGTDLLADGMLSFMTAPLTASITVPVFDPDGGTMPGDSDGGVDGGADGGADGGVDGAAVSDVGVSDLGITDVGAAEVSVPEVTTDGDATEVGTDAGATEVGTDAGTGTEAGADAAPTPPPAPVMPGEQPVTVAFNNLTDPEMIPAHITVTVNGAPFPDVLITPPDDMHPGYTITPKTMWPANATITITVDADAADVLGVKLGSPASATFVTGS